MSTVELSPQDYNLAVCAHSNCPAQGNNQVIYSDQHCDVGPASHDLPEYVHASD